MTKQQKNTEQTASIDWTKEDSMALLQAHGVSLREPLRFKINLCEDGSVITKDGEYLGTWEMDENEHPSFFPDGASDPLFFSGFIGLLSEKIREWHEAGGNPVR